MFKRIENWLRKIIADEVQSVEVSLAKERQLLVSALSNTVEIFKSEVQSISAAAKVDLDAAFADINASCDKALADFKTTLRKPAHELLKEAPSHWTADAETHANDLKLKFVKGN